MIKIQLITGLPYDQEKQQNEVDDESISDNVPLVSTVENNRKRRKRISFWKRLLYCGISFFANICMKLTNR